MKIFIFIIYILAYLDKECWFDTNCVSYKIFTSLWKGYLFISLFSFSFIFINIQKYIQIKITDILASASKVVELHLKRPSEQKVHFRAAPQKLRVKQTELPVVQTKAHTSWTQFFFVAATFVIAIYFSTIFDDLWIKKAFPPMYKARNKPKYFFLKKSLLFYCKLWYSWEERGKSFFNASF